MSGADAAEEDQGQRASVTRVLGAAIFGGAIAGAGAAGIDVMWSWGQLDQFLAGFGGKLRLLLFLLACYALAGAVIGASGAALALGFSRLTRLGDLIRAAAAAQRSRAADDPAAALAALAYTLVSVPMVAAMIALVFKLANKSLATRKHIGLVIAVAMCAGIVAVALGLLLSFVLSRPLERGLVAMVGRKRIGPRLTSPWAPAVATLGMFALAGIGIVVASWKTVQLLHLRWLWILLLGSVLAVGGVRAGHRIATYVGAKRRLIRRVVMAATFALPFLLLLAAGAPEGVRKGSNRYSGLGGPLTRIYRAVGDLDRDGHSRLLGGGDCDDWDPSVHPGAVEIPDDGIDQNCVGGDATVRRDPAAAAFVPVPATVPSNFNVVLLTIDTVRADHFSSYGYKRKTTPRMDEIADQGALFVNSWAHAPSTRYSMPAILTGRHPLQVRYDYSVHGWPGLSPKAVTIAEILKSRGFTTAAVLNYWYFDQNRRMNQGFDSYDNHNKRLHKGVPGKGPAETRGSSSKEQTDKVLQLIEKHAAQRFFIWAHYYDPHYEYENHDEVKRWGNGKIDRYDNEIAFTDLHIGRIVDDLRKRGLYDRTVFVITGDHGEGFGEHGIDLHGYHLYAAQTRVPLIIRVPGLKPRRITTPVGHVDILATLANLAGAGATTEMLGRSLLDMISGAAPADADRTVFQQLSYENNNEMRAAASKDCHVIYNVSPDTSWELYRLDRDPQEKRDSVDDPGPCKRVREELARWYDSSQIPAGAAEALLADKPPIAKPIEVDFGSMTLLEASMPTTVRAGKSFELTLTYAATGRLPGGWKIFAHFEGAKNGRFLGDHAPVRPFEWWRAGQFIRYSHTVTVPRHIRPGPYKLWFGLFKKSDRKPASSGKVQVIDNRAHVGTVQVVR